MTFSGHSGAVHSLIFLPGRPQTTLLSADSNGAVYCHTLTSWVVRMSVSTKMLSEGNRQPLLIRVFPIMKLPEDVEDAAAQVAARPMTVLSLTSCRLGSDPSFW